MPAATAGTGRPHWMTRALRSEMTMMPGNEPGRMPAVLRASSREWAAVARRAIRQHKIAAGVTAAALAVAVAATVIGPPGQPHGPAPRVPGFALPPLGHPGGHGSPSASAGRPARVNFFA